MNQNKKIGIIGVGNIGFSLSKGISQIKFDKSIFAFDRNDYKLNRIINFKDVSVETGVENVIRKSEIIFLCIRTNQVLDWINKYKEELTYKTLVLLQSGLYIKDIEKTGLPLSTNVIKAITNVNISVNLGHTVILKNQKYSNFTKIIDFFQNLGTVIVVNSEKEQDDISLITGCTPAMAGLISDGLAKEYNENNLRLLVEVLANSFQTINKENLKPLEYINKTYSKDGIFKRCIESVQSERRFYKTLENWLEPLKNNLK